MNGELQYVRGDGFDAQLELRQLAKLVAKEKRHSGYWSGLRLLRDFATTGFSPSEHSPLLEPTGTDDVFIFEDSGLRLAFDVPGNGRHPTPDIALLSAEFCPLSRAARRETRAASITQATVRRRTGERRTWPLVKNL